MKNNPVKQAYGYLMYAENPEDARKLWQDVCQVQKESRVSRQDRADAYCSLCRDLRDRLVYEADNLYLNLCVRHGRKQQMESLQTALRDLDDVLTDDGLEQKPTVRLPLVETLEHCAASQLKTILPDLIQQLEKLPETERNACARKGIRLLEDRILTQYLEDLPPVAQLDWQTRYWMNLFRAVDDGAYGEYTLAFADFDGENFVVLTPETLAECEGEAQMRRYVTILRDGLLQMPGETRERTVNRLLYKLNDCVIDRMDLEGSPHSPETQILIRLSLALSHANNWLYSDKLHSEVLGEYENP